MPFNKGTLDKYRLIITKELEARNLNLTGSIVIGGNIVVTGSVSGSSYEGMPGGGDMLKSVYDTNDDGVVEDSDLLEGSTKIQVQTHSPQSHGTSHGSGEADAVSITKSQVSDIANLNMIIPQLSVTGSDISSISGSLIVTGSVSGSSYDGPLVTSVVYSGSTALTKAITFTGSGAVTVSQSGQVLTVSGSQAAAGVSGFAKSGSSELTGNVYLTGSTSEVTLSQSGQVIDVALASDLTVTNVTATNITGSTLVSGSTFLGPAAVITYITGSTLVSGSEFRGPVAVITSIIATTLTGSTVSGSTYQGNLVTSLAKSGSSALIGDTYFSGSGAVYLTQTGQVIEISGSQAAAGVSSIAYSGSSSLSGEIFVSGSTNINTEQTGQGIIFSLPTDISLTNVTATNITGSTLVSGSTFLGAAAVITSITGSTLVSGSTVRGKDVIVTNIIATNITGSTLVSGSDFRGPTATITNVYATNVSGSGNLSGSTLEGILESHRVKLTGSTYVSDWRHPDDERYFSGSYVSGSVDATARTTVRMNAAGTGFARRRINFVEGAGVSLTVGDDAANEEVDVQITASGTPAKLTPSYTIYSGAGAGGPYFAQNEDGTLDYSGSDAVTVINNAASAVDSAGGGLLFFKSAEYVITGAAINIYTSVSYVGESRCKIASNYDTGVRFKCGWGGNVFTSPDTPVHAAHLAHFTIDGDRFNVPSGHGIYGSFRNCVFEDLFIYDIDDSGVYLERTGSETSLWDNHFIACHIYWCNDYGLYIGNEVSDTKIYGGNISNCSKGAVYIDATAGAKGNHRFSDVTLQVSDRGAYMNGSSATAHFNQCSIDQIVKDGLYFSGSTKGSVMECKIRKTGTGSNETYSHIFVHGAKKIKIIGNDFWCAQTDPQPRFVIGWSGSTSEFIAIANNFNSNAGVQEYLYGVGEGQAGTSVAFPTNYLVRNNMGFVTEKVGTASINSPSGSFAHSLDAVPNFVTLTASGSVPTQFSWSHSGSAGIWVYHDAGGQISVNWKAEA